MPDDDLRKFAYRVVDVVLANDRGSHAVSEQLNELGEDGWRLVGSIIEEGYTTKLILIRERAV